MQLTIPHAIYGDADYFGPTPIREWLYKQGHLHWGLVGKTSSGNGYTNGVTNYCSVYMVYNIQPEDATALGLLFPNIGVHLSKQYE